VLGPAGVGDGENVPFRQHVDLALALGQEDRALVLARLLQLVDDGVGVVEPVLDVAGTLEGPERRPYPVTPLLIDTQPRLRVAAAHELERLTGFAVDEVETEHPRAVAVR
jgi:hypothetical protein